VSFWEDPEVVASFAAREVDHRLRDLAGRFSFPARTRVLDIGCAGGRNTLWLAARGFDVWALDASEAMVTETRRRLADVLGPDEAARRCRRGRMDDLGDHDAGSFDLGVALGVFQSAAGAAEWDRALAESARVLTAGGYLLVADFTPRMNPGGAGLRAVAGEPHVYDGFASGRSYLLDGPELDAAFGAHGLEPWVPTEVVEKSLESGVRSTANALYVKRGGGAR